MAARSRFVRRPFEYVETLTTGSAEGVVNINHNLGTTDYTVYIEDTATQNQIVCPIRSIDNNNSSIETTFSPSKTVKITIQG